MTISLQASASGSSGQINIGATPVVSVTVASGLPFCKNKLFNGEVTRINQRGFNGDWSTSSNWVDGAPIAQQELCYGYDMWARLDSVSLVQPIEAGNFRPSTVHTISGDGVTTAQITSPASGNWNIYIPHAARNIQVEEGSVATPFEIRPIGFELAQCQRYYQNLGNCWVESGARPINISFQQAIRTAPHIIGAGLIIDYPPLGGDANFYAYSAVVGAVAIVASAVI